ncbi:MAG TPA: glycoside hydrolase family 38 C-terminal domain-containing protein [Candidatus Dormibacteraeota bacterium]
MFTDRAPLEVSAFEVRGEPIPFEEAVRGEYRPIAAGDRWGPPWSTTWFHVTGRAPAGASLVVLIDLGFMGQTGFTCEALAWRDGRAWRGVDPNHRWLPLEGAEIDFYLEAAANPTGTVGGPGSAQSMLALRSSPEPLFTFGSIEAALLDANAWAELVDAKIARELSEQPRDADPAHRVTAVGHAHIDTAWLWPLREAKRKVARSWSTQLELMDEYPEHRFAASQPEQYTWLKNRHPELYDRVRRRVEEGRWEPVGAMWVEADSNLPSGEALVRQVLYGQRFWQQEFGRISTVGFLPDGFGFPASLPQILAGAGCTSFLTQKLSWNEVNKLPHNTFWWEGIDGTRLLTHFPPADTYNGIFEVREVLDCSRRFRDRGRSDRSLYLFGWGDGGGGPEPEHLEIARRLRGVEGVPAVELGSVKAFFAAVAAESPSLATWAGELYFELHRGTYTSQARTKRLNRQAEAALHAAELWSVVAGGEYPRTELEAAWKTLLVNQFHDILPGSSVDWVYEQAERELAGVVGEAEALAAGAIHALAGAGQTPTWFNPTGTARREVVEDAIVEVPACGYTTVTSRPEEGLVEASERHLENELLRVEWDGEGRLTSVFDREHGREVLAAGERGNVLRLHRDEPALWDAWDLDITYEDSFEELPAPQSVRVTGAGLRGAVEMTRAFSASSLTQRLVLDHGSRVLRFETEVDWHEKHKVLRAYFPVSVRGPHATYEIQFGHIERPTHRNTSWDEARFEVCAHRWVDLGEAGYGVALLNDCKYGHNVLGSVIGISLLRAPQHPDPSADQGAHRFTYALMPHAGDFRSAGVIAAAESLNPPLLRADTALAAGTSASFLSVDTPQVVVSAVKRAEDSGAFVVRLYEAWGGACRARLRTSLPIRRATLTDLLERESAAAELVDGEVRLDLRPFQILTLKLEK